MMARKHPASSISENMTSTNIKAITIKKINI